MQERAALIGWNIPHQLPSIAVINVTHDVSLQRLHLGDYVPHNRVVDIILSIIISKVLRTRLKHCVNEM